MKSSYDGLGGALTGRILSLMPEGSTVQVYGAREDVQVVVLCANFCARR